MGTCRRSLFLGRMAFLGRRFQEGGPQVSPPAQVGGLIMERLDSYTYGNLAMDAAKLLLRLKNGAIQQGMVELSLIALMEPVRDRRNRATCRGRLWVSG